MFWYSAIKVIHILSIAAWFGAGVVIVRTLKNESDEAVQQLAQFTISRIQNIASILVVLAGIGMLIIQPDWLKQGWIHTKILLWVIALGLAHMSGSKLKKKLDGADVSVGPIVQFQSIGLICMMLAMILVEFKPF